MNLHTLSLSPISRQRACRRLAVSAVMSTALVAGLPQACAQDSAFPQRAVRMIIPFAAGGAIDIMARPIGAPPAFAPSAPSTPSSTNAVAGTA